MTKTSTKFQSADQKVDRFIVIDKAGKSHTHPTGSERIDLDEMEKANRYARLFTKLPDTREGWVLANARLIDMHFNSTNPEKKKKLVLDISDIRPYGAKIHGFGGTASGPMPLIEMLFDINQILNERAGQKLTAVDATDICNLIGKTVVAGNVRRSAELALGSSTNQDFTL